MSNTVIHRDGSLEPFQTEKIIRAIQQIVDGVRLDDPFVAVFKIIKNFELKLPDQIRTEDIDELLLKAIEPLIAEDPMFDLIATRQLAKIINRSITGRFQSFAEYIQYAVGEKLLDPRLLEFNL
jgi:ribonucleoside-diphosphate reductase alpha chain